MRLAFARICQETNAFSPVRSTLEDFRRTHWLEGRALLDAAEPEGIEAPGFGRNVELSGFLAGARAVAGAEVEPVPLLSAWAVPGGPVEPEAFAHLRDRLLDALAAAGPVDGIYLALHGAMSAVGDPDPEGGLLQAVRAAVGPTVRIAASFDLHGQMTPRKLNPLDIAVAYRTNPHRDHARTGARAGALLARAVRGEVRPVLAWRSLPMLLGGGTTVDFFPTMRPIYRWMRRMERRQGVLALSLFNCHIWSDHPDLGWSAVVVTDGDEALAERLADELAERAWAVREVHPPAFLPVGEAIRKARRHWLLRRLGTVCICDASDVVGAGAPGENTALIRALVEEGAGLRCFAAIRDAAAVAALWALPAGEPATVEVGGRFQPELNPPLRLEGRVGRRLERSPFGRQVVFESGDLRLVITEAAPLVMHPDFYRAVGLRPWWADVVVVKSLFPFRWYFLAQNRKAIYAASRGATDLDWIYRVERADPVYPRDEVPDWRPADRRRRGAA